MEEIQSGKNDRVLENKIWDKSFAWVCATHLVTLILFSGIRIAFGLGWFGNIDGRWVEVGFSITSQILIMLTIPLVSIWLWKKRHPDPFIRTMQPKSKTWLFGAFEFRSMSAKIFGLAIVLGLLMFLFNIFVSSFANGILAVAGFRFPTGGTGSSFGGVGGLFVSLILIGVLPGLCEEVEHRGMLMQSFKRRLGVQRALLFTAILFGLMHFNVVQVIFAAILGYLMGLAGVAAKNIWVPIIIHFMNNSIATYLSYAGQYGWFGGNFYDGLFNLTMGTGMIVYFLVMAITIVGIIFTIRYIARDRYVKNKKAHFIKLVQTRPDVLVHANGVYTLDQFIEKTEASFSQMRHGQVFNFYIDPMTLVPKKPMNLSRTEATLFYGIFFLGGIITAFTLVWGFL
ncbi:MAG: CPBP family intramembrane metalloprotease [Firmicutes bacterium]|nr:CPBP family intramembrane metalloprotease [Bacillota bacterium]